MKAQKSWGPWQLNLNCRMQDLWPQGDSSPAALSTPPAVGRPNPRLSVQKCHWSRSSGHFPFDSGSHSDLLLPHKQPHPSKQGDSPSDPSRCPSASSPHSHPATLRPDSALPQGMGKLILSPSLPSAASLLTEQGSEFFLAPGCLFLCLWIKKGFQELNAAAAIGQQPARLVVVLVPSWGLFLCDFSVASLPFSHHFWLQLQSHVNNAPCVHLPHLVHRPVKHF